MWRIKTRLSVVLFSVAAVPLAGCAPGVPLVVLPTTLPNGVEGQSYAQTLTADGQAPFVWLITSGSLPAGLSLDERNGMITGTPTQSGTFGFTVSVSDASFPVRQGALSYSLTVIADLTVDAALATARVGEAYSHTFAVSGGVTPYQYSLVGLPGGLSFDTNTGTISGTPNVARSDIQLQLTVSDSGSPAQTEVETILLTVKAPVIQITTTSLASGQVNVPYSAQVEAVHGETPYTWSVIAGVLPDGSGATTPRLNTSSGVISGTPTVAGSYTFTIQVTDNDSPATTDTAAFTIEITE